MQANPDPQLRSLMQNFYQSLRQNDVERLDELDKNGLPLSWVQSMSETSLPEYAMKHGSVEAAWWLMSKGIMPESWSEFSGGAWKSFMKKGWQMVMSQEGPDLSLGTYKNIIMVGMKATGERLPSFLEQSSQQLASQAVGLFGKVSRSMGALLKTPIPTVTEEDEAFAPPSNKSPDNSIQAKKVTPKEIKARRVEAPSRTPSSANPSSSRKPVTKKTAKKVAKKSSSKTTTKTTKSRTRKLS